MADFTPAPSRNKSSPRDWIDPRRLYNPRRPAGRLLFLWGSAIFPVFVILVLLSVIIAVLETVSPNIDPDYIGIIVWPFMLAWVAAAVAMTYRRLLELNKSPRWVWLAILPIVNVPLILYLLLKPGPASGHRAD
jgi:uncharacterized membrane protein YhaH (DUF805 family)